MKNVVIFNLEERAKPVDPARWQLRTPCMFMQIGQMGSWSIPPALGTSKDEEEAKPEEGINQGWKQGHHQR